MIRNYKAQTGVAMVEFAIILPFLLMMVFGIVEFGNMLMHFNTLNKATRDAVRYLTELQPTNSDYQGVVTDNKASAINIMSCGKVTCSTATLINPAPCSGGSTCTFTATGTGLITISVSYPYQPIFNQIFGTNIVPGTFSNSTAVMQSIL